MKELIQILPICGLRSCRGYSSWQPCIYINCSGGNGPHKYHSEGFPASKILILFHTLIVTLWYIYNHVSWNACRVNRYSIRIKVLCWWIPLLWKCDSILLFSDNNTILCYCTLVPSTLSFYTLQLSEPHRVEFLKCPCLINPWPFCSHGYLGYHLVLFATVFSCDRDLANNILYW